MGNDNNGINGSVLFNNANPEAAAPATVPPITGETIPDWAERAVNQLHDMQRELSLDPLMTSKQLRDGLWKLGLPPELVVQALATAVRFPDAVGPIFDVAGTRRATEEASGLEAVAAECRAIANHIDDAVMRRRIQAYGDAWAFYNQLHGYTRTAQGAVLRDAERTMRGVMKGWRRPRTSKSAAAQPSKGTAPAAAPDGAAPPGAAPANGAPPGSASHA